MEYKLDIELITGWWSLGGFKLGYKHDVNRVIDETRKLITNPVYGYQTDEKLRECKLFLGRVKTTILQHEWGINCNDNEKQESIAIIDCFIGEIEALKSIWEIDRKKENNQPDKARQLKTNLTNEQGGKLFELLVNGGFIPETDKNGFIWAFGGKVEVYNVSVEWKKTKGLLAYFVDVFNYKIMGNDGIDKRTQWKPFERLFGKSGLRGAKNDYQKTGTTPEGSKQIDAIIKEVLHYK